MKHKILLLSIALSALLAVAAKAQKVSPDISIKFYGGYGLFTPGTETYTDYTSNKTNAFTKYKFGFGNGPHAGAGVSLKLKSSISVGLDMDYFTGSNTFKTNTNGDTTVGNLKAKYSVFSLIPNVSFQLFSGPKCNIYNSMGIITALHTGVSYLQNTTVFVSPTTTSVGTYDYKYNLQLGFQDAFGMQFPLSKQVKLFAQLTGYYLPVSAKSISYVETVTEVSNGTTIITTVIQNVNLVGGSNHNYASTSQFSGNTITINTDEHTTPQHIFSIGINAGISISLKK